MVDADITFNGCTLWFTPNAEVILINATVAFNITNLSILQASCDSWQGITANNSGNKVSVTGSTIKNAYTGVFSSNNALLEVSHSDFIDNYDFAIRLEDMGSPYSGFIKNSCNFNIQNVPSSVQIFNPLQIGIYLQNVAQMSIGDIMNSNSGNHFENLYTGIWVDIDDPALSSTVGIYNNTFKDITNTTLTGSYIEKQKINTCYNKNQYPVLLTFYNTMTNEAIARERTADQKLSQLINDFAGFIPAQREGQLGDAGEENEDIDNTEMQDWNEQNINAIHIKLLRNGVNSLNEEDEEFITMLAPQCPYIGGSAVYKARTLNYYFEQGVMYDDMKACNAVGVYKQGNNIGSTGGNGKSGITMEEELLANIKPNAEIMQIKQDDLIVYPNPGNDIFNIRYTTQKESRIIIKDMTGRTVMIVLLPGGESTKAAISLEKFSAGIYTYTQVVNGVSINTGKLIKE